MLPCDWFERETSRWFMIASEARRASLWVREDPVPQRLSSMQKGYFLVSPCSVVLVLLTSTVALFLSWREEWTKARKERQEGEAGLACGVESEGTASGAEGEEKRRVPG